MKIIPIVLRCHVTCPFILRQLLNDFKKIISHKYIKIENINRYCLFTMVFKYIMVFMNKNQCHFENFNRFSWFHILFYQWQRTELKLMCTFE